MADQMKHKTPEELGEAVGRKIEELFGGMFQDEADPPTKLPRPAAEQPVSPATPVSPPASRSAPGPLRTETGQTATSPASSAPGGGPGDWKKVTGSFEELAERIEALILSMEWEVNPESATELATRFKEIGPLMPASGPARNILAMNERVLSRYNTAETPPHRSLMKFLQQSVTGLKLIHASQGKRPLGEDLAVGLTKGYKEIMAAPVGERVRPVADESGRGASGEGIHKTLLTDVGSSIRSLEELSQRLGRIMGFLRKGGGMSEEEITRRLGTVEQLLSERVEKLFSLHKALSRTIPGITDGPPLAGSSTTKAGWEGLLMVLWEGMPVAIPASAVAALYPLNKTQSEQFVNKSTVTLASRAVKRLPLKKPQGSDQRVGILPSWLVHLSWGGKEFFMMADRSLGYRRTPEGVDVFRDKRIKIGPTTFAILNLGAFR